VYLIEIGLNPAKEGYKNPGSDEVLYRPLDGLRVLTITIPDGVPSDEALASITSANGVKNRHSDEAPTWVSVPDKPSLEEMIAEKYGIPQGRPADVETTHYTVNGPPGVDMSVDVVADPAPEAGV
jgi:hypothetical protein